MRQFLNWIWSMLIVGYVCLMVWWPTDGYAALGMAPMPIELTRVTVAVIFVFSLQSWIMAMMVASGNNARKAELAYKWYFLWRPSWMQQLSLMADIFLLLSLIANGWWFSLFLATLGLFWALVVYAELSKHRGL